MKIKDVIEKIDDLSHNDVFFEDLEMRRLFDLIINNVPLLSILSKVDLDSLIKLDKTITSLVTSIREPEPDNSINPSSRDKNYCVEINEYYNLIYALKETPASEKNILMI